MEEVVVFKGLQVLNSDSTIGRGCRGAMIPAKMISEPQDLQNYLQAPQTWSPSLSDVTKPPAILSPRPAFWLQ